MMRVYEVRNLVVDRFNYYVDQAKALYNYTKPIYFSTREEYSIGRVDMDKRVIKLNKWLIQELGDVYLNTILPHEIAHIVYEAKNGKIFSDDWDEQHPPGFWEVSEKLGEDLSVRPVYVKLFDHVLYGV